MSSRPLGAAQPEGKAGIRWGDCFLEHGTQLRTKHYGEFRYAGVVGDKAVAYCAATGEDNLGHGEVFDSIPHAIDRLRGHVNAWRVTEVRRPHDTKWVPAEELRRRVHV